MKPQSHSLWIVSAVAGFLLFPILWLIIGWFWLYIFPWAGMYSEIVFKISAAQFHRIAVVEPLLEPLPIVAFLGALLGGASGWAKQTGPHFATRATAFGTSLLVLALIYLQLPQDTMSLQSHGGTASWQEILRKRPDLCYRTWFLVLPFVSPFLYSLGLFTFALTSRSRPSSLK